MTFVRTTKPNAETPWEALNACAGKDTWKSTASVSLMTHAWVLSAIRMLNVILFVVDAFANLVSRATELFARMKMNAMILEVRAT